MKAKRCQYCCCARETVAAGEPSTRMAGKDGKIRYIALTQGLFATVDVDDYERLAKYRWYFYQDGNTFYAFRREGKRARKIIMHREIMDAPKGLVVDHRDGDGLNNRKSNLRVCTQAQNACNRRPRWDGTSVYKGVSWYKPSKKWEAKITYKGKCTYLGRFDDEIEAAKVYDAKAKELFEEFAYLNFGDLTTKIPRQ